MKHIKIISIKVNWPRFPQIIIVPFALLLLNSFQYKVCHGFHYQYHTWTGIPSMCSQFKHCTLEDMYAPTVIHKTILYLLAMTFEKGNGTSGSNSNYGWCISKHEHFTNIDTRGRAHLLVTQCQKLSLENTYTSNSTQTDHVIYLGISISI